MKLRNKKTGETIENCKVNLEPFEARDFECNSLAELNEEWEDAPEEPKGIKSVGNIGSSVHIELGSKEEAERAVEKLKALKRLKDKGFRFMGWQDSVSDNNPDMALFKLNEDAWETDTCNDLDLLFGGEE